MMRSHELRRWCAVLALGSSLGACGREPSRDPAGAGTADSRSAAPLPSAASSTPIPAGALDPDASTYPYPHPVQYFSFEAQRQTLRMAYLDVAPQQPNGKTVLLLHGKNFSAAYFRDTIAALTQAGFRAIAPDQVGFGKSSKPERYQYSFAGLATHTRELLRARGVERAAVVGHSMGGMLAVRFALLFPDLAEKLVLVNPIGLEDYGALVPYRPVDFWYERELASTPDKIRAYQTQAYFDGRWKPDYEPLIELLAGFTRHPEYPRVAWASALTYDMILTQPVVHDLPRLALPTQLIIGLRDRTALGKDLVPEPERAELGRYDRLAPAAAKAIPRAELVALDGVGHLPQVEDFDTYRDALLGFLKR